MYMFATLIKIKTSVKSIPTYEHDLGSSEKEKLLGTAPNQKEDKVRLEYRSYLFLLIVFINMSVA